MQKHYRHEYVIGDLQGCFGAFHELLAKLNFDERCDKIWLTGDIVARGEDSLSTLREVKRLSDIGALCTVLGNHDITLIATWLGVLKPKPKDKTLSIFHASDCDELLNWLRVQPLLAFPNERTVLVHAGIPPHWTIASAANYAKELQVQLQGSLTQLTRLLPHLYNKQIEGWTDDIHGYARLRMITNYFTRMRLCTRKGVLEFDFNEGLDARDEMPIGFLPWFEWRVERERKVLFGHWAALEAKVASETVQSLDGGCVWGGRLVAYRLADEQMITV